ncbi:kelch domain-containing protein 2-like [Saccoglossus kowalevskii]|uniref:Acyl-CoA-binding domain-containing protein 4-like n=1 Tax=Saccoglossus kowalevskii TaxID=10224 RepID=A0ABM0LZJ6_SACKO|nr:PREDICTED: acyl-CoA-binding domain-containing protein 4-like [Saccoglossus kowalevskii]
MQSDETFKVYAVMSVQDTPKELFSKEDCRHYHCHFPLPLPEYLVCFTLGQWDKTGSELHIRIVLDSETEPVEIGILTQNNRAVCWQGEWDSDFHRKSLHMLQQGRMAKLQVIAEDVPSITVDSGLELSRNDMLQDISTAMNSADENQDIEESFVTPKVMNGDSKTKSARGSNKKKRKPSYEETENTPSLNPVTKKTKNATRRLQEEWKNSPKKSPSERWGHSLCTINSSEAILIGGQGTRQQLSKDSIWLLNTEQKTWRVPTILNSDNAKPQYRMGHSTTYDPIVKCVYVFGGSKNLRWYNDIHVLDVETWTWSLVKTNGKAPTRAYHSTTLFGSELFVFGGVYPNPDPQPDGCSNQVHVYNPATESWYEPIVMGEKPLPRSGHSATLVNDKLIIFGGWDAPMCYNDLHILDLSMMDFTKPEIKGTPPSPRSWHAAVGLSNNRLLIHGGFDGDHALGDSFIFHLDTCIWTQLKHSLPISARAGHSMICLDNPDQNKDLTFKRQKILVFGGGDNEGSFFNQTTVFMVSDQL